MQKVSVLLPNAMPAAQHPVLSERCSMQAGAAVPTRTAMHTLTAPGLHFVSCTGECVATVQQRVSGPGRSLPFGSPPGQSGQSAAAAAAAAAAAVKTKNNPPVNHMQIHPAV